MAFLPTTWNPADKEGGVSLSNGNLTATSGGGNNGPVRSVFGASSGKWYWELTYTGTLPVIGVALPSWVLLDYPGYRADSLGFAGGATPKKIKDATPQNYGAPWSSGVVLGVMLNMDAGTVEMAVNGVAQGVMFSGLVGTYHAASGSSSTANAAVTANFGGSAFAFAPPTGYNAGFGVPVVTTLSGTVTGSTGSPVSRAIRAIREDTGAYVGGVISDATTGAYTISTEHPGEHTVVAYPVTGENLPALVHHGVIPI